MANRKAIILLSLICWPLLGQSPAAASHDPRIKFKDGTRYLRDLSAALHIPRESICKELGLYDCYSDAFRIVLGGVEPYRDAIVEPLESASLTSPIALDRVALRVCTLRVTEDAKDPQNAILFRPGTHDMKWRKEVASLIYDALLQRGATGQEVERLIRFYDTVAAEGRPAPDTAHDWTVLSCFAVSSSLESIFY